MGEKLSAFNPVDFLQGEAEIDEFLAEARIDENPDVFAIALGHVAKHRGGFTSSVETSLNTKNQTTTVESSPQPQSPAHRPPPKPIAHP